MLNVKRDFTASKFGNICKMRININCKIRVHNLLYKSPITCKEVDHGIEFEPLVKTRFEELYGMKVKLSWLFIEKRYDFF